LPLAGELEVSRRESCGDEIAALTGYHWVDEESNFVDEVGFEQSMNNRDAPMLTLTQVAQSCSSNFPTWWRRQL